MKTEQQRQQDEISIQLQPVSELQEEQTLLRKARTSSQGYDPLKHVVDIHVSATCPDHGERMIKMTKSGKTYFCREPDCSHRWPPRKSRAAKQVQKESDLESDLENDLVRFRTTKPNGEPFTGVVPRIMIEDMRSEGIKVEELL